MSTPRTRNSVSRSRKRSLSLFALIRIADEERQILRLGYVFDSSCDVGEKRIRRIENDVGNGVVLADDELASRGIRHEPEFDNGGLDPRTCGRAHSRGSVEYIGHRSHGNPGLSSNGLDVDGRYRPRLAAHA